MTTQTIAADEFIRQQHSEIRELFDTITAADPQDRREPFEQLVRLLAVHETAEEMVIYPAIELDDEGRAAAAARKAEEDQAKKALVDLEKMDPATPEFLEALTAFQADVEAHASAEEDDVLPLLARINDDQLNLMGQALKVVQSIAPTHPHKMAPESALGNVVVGPFVAVVDRVRDAIRDARR